MDDALYIAVDLGAGSGRVFVAGVAVGELLLEETRRFHYAPGHRFGHLRWDFSAIFEEIKTGLRAAGARALSLGRTIRSVGVDSWAVDYGLVDAEGCLVEDPVCYRDDRTVASVDEVSSIVPREEIYDRTGIQFLPFNTIYQLRAHANDGIPAAADALLLVPDLVGFRLTGRRVAEYTNATTTQLVAARTGRWDLELAHRIGIPAGLLPEIVPAGTELGQIRPELARELGLDAVRVVAPATHDTASAVVGTPLDDGWAYVSSGTWSLVGVERSEPLLGPDAARHDFTNEGGAFGTVRFLKNVMGLWILESCRAEWAARGYDLDHDRLLASAADAADDVPLLYPDDPRFLNPPSMLAAIDRQLGERGERAPVDPPSVARMILDSLALRYASVVRKIEEVTGDPVRGLHVVGGGSRNRYLNQATATATGRPVLAGPVEATVVGNVLVQAVAAGRFASVAEGRAHVAACVPLDRFDPRPSEAAEARARRYAEVEDWYVRRGAFERLGGAT